MQQEDWSAWRERDEQEYWEHETSLEEALADKTKVVKFVVDKWFVDKGFGFGKDPYRRDLLHPCQRGARWRSAHDRHGRVGAGRDQQPSSWGRNASKEEKDKANSVAQQVKRAPAVTAELAAQSERKVSAGGDFATSPSSTVRRLTCGQVAHTPRPQGDSFNLAQRFRGGRPLPATRAQEAVASIDETIGFCIKVPGSDEGPIRRKLTTGKPEDLWRESETCGKHTFFERQSSFKQRTREEFEEKFTRRTQGAVLSSLASRKEQEKELAEVDE